MNMLIKLLRKSKPSAEPEGNGLDAIFDQIREKDFKRLDTHGHVYLDYTGGGLYAATQLEKHHDLLKNEVFGNPHSSNPTSQNATHLVDDARQKVLGFFNASDDYYCIFTANASGALKIVGECYPFCEKGQLVLFADNHNSVNGIREFCRKGGAAFEYIPIHYEDLRVDRIILEKALKSYDDKENKLFAFPAQSNVSGVKHDLGWIKKAKDKGWDVLLDAAAFVPTNKLDLSTVKPDFVCVSFYKIFGYPTGLGCLLVRKSTFHKLQKPWFAGGTVSLASVRSADFFLTDNHERFEDGTINYLDIPAVKIGLDYIDSIGIEKINAKVMRYTAIMLEGLKKIKHANNERVVKIFGPKNSEERGSNIILNIFAPNGEVIPFEQVEKEANERKISLRSGCFCNPGIDEINNCITTEELAQYFSSRDRGDYYDMMSALGKMRGAIRISIGYPTNQSDIDRFLSFIETFKDRSL
jgi:selenocysteine lyase/cysteine desulfurase